MRCLSRYIAASARRISSSASLPGAVHGDADAGADRHLPALEPERLGEAVDDPTGEPVRVLRLHQARQDDRELVAAEPADGVAGTDRGAQPGGHLAEQLVAGRVPQGVVDLLEAVEVAEEHAQVGAAARRR